LQQSYNYTAGMTNALQMTNKSRRSDNLCLGGGNKSSAFVLINVADEFD